MAKQKGPDKNLQNVVEELERDAANSHHAKQIQQDANDRRHQNALNHDESGQ